MPLYPDEEHRMSIYGKQEPNPEEAAGQWKEITKINRIIDRDHLATKGGKDKYFQGVEQLTDYNGSFYGEAKQHLPTTTSHYDRMFHIDGGYDGKLHRDDRQHTVGLDMQHEELRRTVPVRSSTEYGRRVDRPFQASVNSTEEEVANEDRGHVRIDRCMKGFYRTRGTGIPTSLDRQPNCP